MTYMFIITAHTDDGEYAAFVEAETKESALNIFVAEWEMVGVFLADCPPFVLQCPEKAGENIMHIIDGDTVMPVR